MWALLWAIAWKKDFKVIQLLIKAGSKLESATLSSLFSFNIERHPRCLDVAKMLIEAGADINWCDKDGNSGLAICLWNMGIDLLKLLLDHGVDIDTLSFNERYSPPEIAILHIHCLLPISCI